MFVLYGAAAYSEGKGGDHLGQALEIPEVSLPPVAMVTPPPAEQL